MSRHWLREGNLIIIEPNDVNSFFPSLWCVPHVLFSGKGNQKKKRTLPFFFFFFRECYFFSFFISFSRPLNWTFRDTPHIASRRSPPPAFVPSRGSYMLYSRNHNNNREKSSTTTITTTTTTTKKKKKENVVVVFLPFPAGFSRLSESRAPLWTTTTS